MASHSSCTEYRLALKSYYVVSSCFWETSPVPSLFRTWRVIVGIEPGSSQRRTGEGQQAMWTRWKMGKTPSDIRESVFTMRVVKCWSGVQRGGGIPVIWDIQTSNKYSPEQLDPVWPVLSSGGKRDMQRLLLTSAILSSMLIDLISLDIFI